jgi:hypothetical protein
MQELLVIQSKLKVAKDKRNEFLKANFRSAEDILKAVKPLLEETKCVLLLSDEIVAVGNDYKHHKEWNKDNAKYGTKDDGTESYEGQRFYVKATVTLINKNGDKISTNAYAREDIEKAGVDVSQVTGSASSYARKYALNGLFALDDGKDEDIHPTLDKAKEEAMANEFKEVEPLLKKCETQQQVVDLNMQRPNLHNYAPYVELRNNIYKSLTK